MQHIPPLIIDLAIILTTAGLSLVVCRLLKQPIVIGYIIAGFLISPHFPLMPTVSDVEGIATWAEIGVIFLLFSIGLEFSYKKLAQIGKHAFAVAFVKVFFVFGLGYFVGHIFKWSEMDCLFLGGILSISSTAIVARTFDDMKKKSSDYTNFIFAVLIIEDLFAIMLLGFLSTFAITKTFSGPELGNSMVQLFFFIILCFVLGLYFVPRVFRRISSAINDETTLVISVGSCLMMVAVATYVGFSAALGAFVMGSILSETELSKNIERVIEPLKYLFSAIFFVSIGMLINPTLIAENWLLILIISVLTIVGKFIGTLLGAVLAGKDMRTSVKAGMTLSQIGEFSFIIATLGTQLKVTSSFLYPIAIAVSVITSFLTPYMILWSDPVYMWINDRLPPKFKISLATYSNALQDNRISPNFFTIFWEMYGIKLLLNATLIVSIGLFSKFILGELRSYTDNRMLLEISVFAVTMLVALPFFWPILFGQSARSMRDLEISYEKAKAIHVGIIIGRSFIGALLITFLIGQFSSLGAVSTLLLLGVAIISFPLSKYAEALYHYFERGFIENIKNEGKDGDSPSS